VTLLCDRAVSALRAFGAPEHRESRGGRVVTPSVTQRRRATADSTGRCRGIYRPQTNKNFCVCHLTLPLHHLHADQTGGVVPARSQSDPGVNPDTAYQSQLKIEFQFS
jgi:hypothetical protein